MCLKYNLNEEREGEKEDTYRTQCNITTTTTKLL